MAVNPQTIRFLVEFQGRDRASPTMQRFERRVKRLGGTIRTTGKQVGFSLSNIAQRALLTIPVWIAFRNVFMSINNTFTQGVKSISEFDKALQRAKNELVGFTNSSQVIERVRNRAEALARETGESVGDIVEAFRLFKTAGIDVEASIAGMDTAVKGALATLGDTADSAKLTADLYNLFGDRITEVSTVQDKMNFIMATMVSLMPTNVINIQDFSAALKNFAGVAKVSNLSLEEMLTLIAVSSTLMQRGSRAGTQLSRSFERLSVKTREIELFLGKPRGNLSDFELFLEILTKAVSELQSGRNINADIADIFGLRGGRVAKANIADLTKLLEELRRQEEIDFGESMEIFNERTQNATDSIDRQLKIFNKLREELVRTFVTAVTNGTDFGKVLKSINKSLDDMVPTIKAVGSSINDISKSLAPLLSPAQTVDKDSVESFFGIQRPKVSSFADFARFFNPFNIGRAINESFGLQETEGLLFAQEKMLKNLEERRRLQATRISQGLPVPSVDLGVIPIVGDPEDRLKVEEDMNLTFEERELIVERLKTLGFSQLEIEVERLKLMEEMGKGTKEIGAQQLKILQVLNREIIKASNNLKTAFEEGITDLLLGETDLMGLGQKIGDTIRRGITGAIAGNVTEQIFKTTGIGEIFGRTVNEIRFGKLEGSIRNGFLFGADLTTNAIIRGFQGGIGAVQGQPGGIATLSSAAGLTLPGFGAGGFFGQPIIGSPAAMTGIGGQPLTAGGLPVSTNVTKGQILGLGLASTLLGFSAFQSSGGKQGSLALPASLLSGLGAGALGLSSLGLGVGVSVPGLGSASLGASALGPVGIGLILGGILLSGFSKSTQETVDTKNQTNQITTKIDVTNKSLELVNRNLIALRNSIETFILPESAAFSEKTNLEDQFAISAGQGL